MGNKNERKGLAKIFTGPLAIIAVWYSTHVGPGFAGGAQQVRYFLHDGYLGVVIGPVILILVSVWTSFIYSEFSRQTNSYNFRTFYDTFFGKLSVVFSNIKEISSIIGITVSVALVYATGGQLLANLFGIPAFLAGIFSTIVVGVLVMYGEDMVRNSATVITVVLVLLVIFIGVVSLPKAFPGAMAYMNQRTINTTPATGWYNIFLYFPLFVSYLDVGMVTSKGVIRSRRDSLTLAIGGSLLLGLSLIMMNMLFASGMPGVDTESLPTLWMLQNVLGASKITQILYTLFAWLALVSTGVGGMGGWVARIDMSLGRSRRFRGVNVTVRRAVLTFAAIAVSIGLGQFGIMDLVYYGYGIMGTINVYCFIIPASVLGPWRLKKLRAAGKASLEGMPEES